MPSNDLGSWFRLVFKICRLIFDEGGAGCGYFMPPQRSVIGVVFSRGDVIATIVVSGHAQLDFYSCQ